MTDSTSFALTMATQQRHTGGRRGGITYINTHNGKKKNKKKEKEKINWVPFSVCLSVAFQ